MISSSEDTGHASRLLPADLVRQRLKRTHTKKTLPTTRVAISAGPLKICAYTEHFPPFASQEMCSEPVITNPVILLVNTL